METRESCRTTSLSRHYRNPVPNSPRRFQFRLRTLMIGVTLLAVQCAFVMWFIRDRERLRQETIRRVREEAMAWMEREHRAQAETDSLRSLLRANNIEPPPSPP
jgi:hypothetical protein